MKASLNFEDGVVVKLPQEITDRLRKELIKDDGQLKVDQFRAVAEVSCIRIAIMSNSNDVWDKKAGHSDYDKSNAMATHLLTPYEIREIIEGLTEMLGD